MNFPEQAAKYKVLHHGGKCGRVNNWTDTLDPITLFENM